MHVPINGVRLFFDVQGAKLVPDGPAMRESPHCSCFMLAPGSTIRSTSPPTRPWRTLPRLSTWIIEAMAEARMVRGKAGTWRNGATTYARSAMLSAS